MSLPPRRDPRSEPGDVPLEEVAGRGGRRPGSQPRSTGSTPRTDEVDEPRSDVRPVSTPPDTSEEDLLAQLAGQLLREERARRAAEERARALEEELAQADRLRDRAVRELQLHIDELRLEVLAAERKLAEQRDASRFELERSLAEAHAEIAMLRARRSPSVRAMAAATLSHGEPERMAQELAAVKRTADEAIAALKDLLQRKEVVLAEGRATLERLTPSVPLEPRDYFGDLPPRASAAPTPRRGITLSETLSDWPELIVGDDPEKK